MRAFTTAGGVPTGVSGNPFPSGVGSNGTYGVVHPSGFYIVAFPFVNGVGVYQISGSGSGTTLSAVTGSPFATTGGFSNALALTADGLLVVANGSTRNLEVFQVNEATGHLTSRFVQAHHALGVTGQLTGLAFAPGSIPGDFNGDARSDVLWRNRVSGQNIGWLMNGPAVSGSAFVGDDGRHELGGQRPRRLQRRRQERCALARQSLRPEHRLADERVRCPDGGFPAADWPTRTGTFTASATSTRTAWRTSSGATE